MKTFDSGPFLALDPVLQPFETWRHPTDVDPVSCKGMSTRWPEIADCKRSSTLRVSNTSRDRVVFSGSGPGRIFLLSPANVRGIRGEFVMSDRAESELAQRLRGQGAPLGEVFSFISGLYFRGKLAYARAFANGPQDVPGVFVITACAGLVSPDMHVTLEYLREISAGRVDPEDRRFRRALDRDSLAVSKAAGKDCQIILLGSIATPKYVGPLLEIFGKQLFFPAEFIGRGDLSRGGLMLRCVEEGVQLTYMPVTNALRRGPRPAKLARKPAKETVEPAPD
jgi:hypothetical protein